MVNDRIGVYVCHCGGNISDVVDVYKVVDAVKDEPNVVIAREMMFTCSDPGQKQIEDDIKEFNLNGVVVASCSPHLHETTFRRAAARAGLNPYLLEHVNIREHVSWAHKHDKEGATEKAIKIVKSGIAKVREARALETIKVEMPPKVLIVGAGIAGIRAALDLSKLGIHVYLVEKSPFVGGRVAQSYNAYPSGKFGMELIEELINEVKQQKNITLITNAEVTSIKGVIGNFSVEIIKDPRYVVADCPRFKEAIDKCPIEVPNEFDYGLTNRKAIYYPYPNAYPELPVIDMESCNRCGECVKICGDAINLDQQPEKMRIDVSAIIFATGFDPYQPNEGEFGFNVFESVITLPQFERLLALCDKKLVYKEREIKDIAFIYCVGSRQREGNEYCSRYCCVATINSALAAIEKFGEINTYHIYRDMRTYGKYERYYEEASKKGARFFRYSLDEPPEITQKGEKLIVKVKDKLTFNEEIELPVDLVVLSVGMVPRKSEIFSMLKVPFSRDGFLQEVHPKLRPVETAIGGVLIGGACQAPKDSVEATASASAAAAKAATYLLKGYAELEPFIVEVNLEKCTGCGDCVKECPYDSIQLKNINGEEKAFVIEAACRGCAACAAVCPEEAINLRGYTYDQLRAQIDAMLM
ncbi:MAG: CoB--CoM heterodisulfide reductase iron-sulfur subunit A family protein [Archaeoglobaceae archaeon]|nr:CoB--CoM heterodisulfide reductase iron-sulfur subunit A family protein [Archaeoglobaceae archaeon]